MDNLWILGIPAIPAAIALIMVPLSGKLRNKLVFLPIVGIAISTVLSLIVAYMTWTGNIRGEETIFALKWTLATIAEKPLMLSIGLDSMGVIMLLVVTIVSLCVNVYSLSYMGSDKRVGWYYTVVSLFTAAMLTLVMSDNLLLIFAMWEMMGLCSYLLIGFWWENESPRKAAQKAFLTTRVGDLGFLIALFAIFARFGSFDMPTILGATYAPAAATVISLGILWAAIGKSAQAPLFNWLPDAMAGPTPSSALIHAATMVAAGVFVVARFLPVIKQSPVVLTVILIVGSVTAIVAATMAAVQHDIKKVLAYSTISQLGLMFVALGLGSASAALFHLFTHAFFKALLFMASGVIIHAVHSQDMRDMGGLRKKMPVTTVVYTIGALALAGIAPFAGFFSKDEILTVAFHQHNYAAFAVVGITSVLTAFYMTRLWVQVFTGKVKKEKAHDGDPRMMVPLGVLAAITCVAGFTFIPLATLMGEHGAWPDPLIAGISTVIALSGIGIGLFVYARGVDKRPTERTHALLGPIYYLPYRKWYVDEAYDFLFVKGFFALAKVSALVDEDFIDRIVNGVAKGYALSTKFFWKFDKVVVDGVVNSLATVSRFIGSLFRSLQNGRLRSYQRYVLVVVVAFMIYVMVKGV